MNPRRSLAPLLALALALGSVSWVVAQDDDYRPVEDPLFGVSSVVPADWQDGGGGIYSRGASPGDLTILAIQAAPATPDQLWTSLAPQFALTEPPEATDSFSSELLDWTIFDFSVELGDMVISVSLALAEQDGVTSLVLLQSAPEEFDMLREAAFLPAVEAFAPFTPEPTPDPVAFDYQSEEVAFPGGSEGVELAGTLTLPNGPGPHPVVITMTGSGPHDRNESLKPITLLEPLAVVAEALTTAGVGVLRYDDRGVGGSTGDYNAASVQELAEDARAAIDYLETRDDVDVERIGLFGHSEGGLYAAMLGASDPRVAYIGLMAPGVIDGIGLIVEQNIAIARSSGSPEEQVQAIGEFAATIMPLVLEGDLDEVERISREFFGQIWDGLTPEEQGIAGDRATFIGLQVDSQLPIYASDWYRSLLGYDPTADWAQVDVPVLGIFGGKDVQVMAESNEAALREALEAAGNDDVTTLTFDDANHLFQEAVTGTIGEYGELEPEFIDGFLETVVDWMVERAEVAE